MNRTTTPKLNQKTGFTIIEVMIALAASLLLMLGLTRAYKLVGDRVTESQSRLELSSTLRDVALRIRDELRRTTSEMTPPGKASRGDGYFVYYEGPFSSNTTTLGDSPPTPPAVPEPIPDYYPTSRFGDIDDYLAFTARAEEGSPFMGFIPQGVLMAHRFANGTMTAAEQSSYQNSPDAITLVPFYANRAEIAYWLSPRWARTATGDIAYDSGSGHPLFPDLNGDQLPDRLDLHRRVLLIRPDLNMQPSRMAQVNGDPAPATLPVDWRTPELPMLIRTTNGLRIVRLTSLTNNQPFFDASTNLVAPGNWTTNVNTFAPHWLCGLARMQQVMDLSVSRVNNSWSTPHDGVTNSTQFSSYGMPSPIARANSLGQLARPENRFAHVRMPEALISGAANASSMPQIALSPPHPYLTLREGIFPNQASHSIGASGPGTLPQFFYGRFAMVGFLRPEFNLADTVSDVAASGAGNTVIVNRGGSDIVASDLLSFDLQIYDPAAPKYVWVGPDGASGNPSNDDGDLDTGFDFDELGLPNTDDELVTMDGLRTLEVLLDNDGLTRGSGPGNYPTPQAAPYPVPPPNPPNLFHLVDRGSFVDLNYTRHAGSAMRGLIQGVAFPNLPSPNPVPPIRVRELAGSVAGLEVLPPAPSIPGQFNFPETWERSGRFVISRGS